MTVLKSKASEKIIQFISDQNHIKGIKISLSTSL